MGSALGKRAWAIPGGRIPLNSTGREPEFTSNDEVCILNTGRADANVEITVYYEDREPVGPYPVKVGARRTRHVRFNDLIDPEAMPLETEYAAVVESDVPVVVQFNRRETTKAENTITATMAFPLE